MLERSVLISLLGVCAAAPTRAHRAAANALLARECTARLDQGDRVYHGHHAYRDMHERPDTSSLSKLLASSKPGGGKRAAYQYLFDQDWDGSLPMAKIPSDPTAYARALSEVTTTAASLLSVAVPTMSADDWTAAKAPFVDYFARADFVARGDVATYRAIATNVAPNALLPLESHRAAGFTELSLTDTPEVTVPVTGDHRILFSGAGRLDTTNPSAVLSVAFDVAGVERLRVSASRTSSDPNEVVSLEEGSTSPRMISGGGYLPTDGTLIGVDDVLTLRLASATAGSFRGAFYIWKA